MGRYLDIKTIRLWWISLNLGINFLQPFYFLFQAVKSDLNISSSFYNHGILYRISHTALTVTLMAFREQ